MYKRAAGYLIVAGAIASRLGGQEVARMQRRVDATLREATRAQEAVIEYRAAHPPRFFFSDSAVLGGRIKVYFDSSLAPQVRAGLDVAEPYVDAMGSVLGRLEPLVFSVVPDSAFNPYDQRYHRQGELNIRQHFASDPKPARTSVDGDPQSIAYVILRALSAAASAGTPSRISLWTNGALPLAPGLDAKVDWATVRLTMVSSPSHLGRECFLGDVPACRTYLGLDEVRGDRDSVAIYQYFDSAGRRRFVQSGIGRARSFARVASDRCLDGSDEACIAVMRGMGGVNVLSGPFIRNSVVLHALRLGGPHATERLLTTPGSYGDALAAAARMPADSLIADWQRHLDDRSGGGSTLPVTVALSSIVWMALCVFLALRSSRWR